ncbi:unnamed protein product, partial [Adineta steineri]
MPNTGKVSLYILIKNNPEIIDNNDIKNCITNALINLQECKININFYKTVPLGD